MNEVQDRNTTEPFVVEQPGDGTNYHPAVSPPPEVPRGHHWRGIVGPTILIGAGAVLLLNTTGLVDWDIWAIMWRLWPVILIAIGLDILIGRRSLAGSALVAPRERLEALADTLDLERVRIEVRTIPVGKAEGLVPFVDEAVQESAAAPAQGHPHGDLGIPADPPRDVQVEGVGLAIDEEPPVVGHLAGNVLDPAERVGPEGAKAEGPAAAGNGVRADGGQGEA